MELTNLTSLTSFFSEAQKPLQVSLFIVLFLICWNIEKIYGVTKDYKKTKHSLTNLIFIIPGALLQFVIGYFFVSFLMYENTNELGLIHLFSIESTFWEIVVIFVILDFAYYVYHVMMHKFEAFWSFHAVHHSDEVLDVSTSLREHPVETVIRLTFNMGMILALGPLLWIAGLHQFIQVISKIIIHGNYRLPDSVDKYLSYIFITPNMHHVHHHYKQPYTDSNYGDLLSCWDRFFGTFRYLSAKDVKFGLDASFEGNPNNFLSLLKSPFNKGTETSIENDFSDLNLVLEKTEK